nr:hypothetical protein [Tanacetum cinerariifolium]
MILESVEHGPLIWPTIKENGVTVTKKYEGLSATEKIQADCDLKETNIIIQGLPSDVYSLVNHQRSPQYGSVHPTQHYSTTYPSIPHAITYPSTPQPNVYSSTIHQDACTQPQSIPQIKYTMSIVNQQTDLAKFPQIDSDLAVYMFKQGDAPINAINKMMSFLLIVISPRFLTTNYQLRNSSNPRQQATIHDGRVIVQPVQRGQSSFAAGNSRIRANILGIGRNNSGQQRIVKCFNCQGEGHISRQCLKTKKRDATWFRDKVLLAAINEEDEEDEVHATFIPPSLTYEPTPPFQEPIRSPLQTQSVTPLPSPPQAQPAQSSSPPQEQPSTTSTTNMTLFNTLLETCTTLSHKVAALEQDKVAQALKILKLKRRFKKLEKQRRSKTSGLKRLRKVDVDKEITLGDMETEFELDAELQGRLEEKDEVNAAAKEVNAAEPTVFDDEEVTMIMAQTMKAEKERLLDELMAKRLHDEEVEQAAFRERQEQDDFKRAQELQQQYDKKQENIDWNVRPIFEREYNNVQTFLKSHRDEEPTKKRAAKETLLQESVKKLRAKVKVSGSHSTQDTPTDDPNIAMPIEDKEKALWVELKILYKPNAADVFWKLQRYMHDPLTWKLYTTCEVHQVSSSGRQDIFMFLEKDYLLTDAVLLLMLSAKLQVDEDCEMAMDLMMKIFMEATNQRVEIVLIHHPTDQAG